MIRIFGDSETALYGNKGIRLYYFLFYFDPRGYASRGTPKMRSDAAFFRFGDIPFKRYELVRWRVPCSWKSRAAFWRLCGRHVHHLTLHNCSVFYKDELWKMINNMKNLTSLYLVDNWNDWTTAGIETYVGYTGSYSQISENRALLRHTIQCSRIRALRIQSQACVGYITRIMKRFPYVEVRLSLLVRVISAYLCLRLSRFIIENFANTRIYGYRRRYRHIHMVPTQGCLYFSFMLF